MKDNTSRFALKYVICLLFCAICSPIFAQITYPIPTTSFERLFYIQRSTNRNTIVYDAIFEKEKELATYPIHIYWISYENGGIIEELNFEQRKLAYGITGQYLTKNQYEFTLVAYKKLIFILELDNTGKPYVKVEINGEVMLVNHIFIQSKGLFKPKVAYIEFFGTHLENKTPMYQKIIP
jgi:hypothetical protein